MRKYIIATFILLDVSLFSFGQTANSTEKIVSFCKVWGFLKYYHPVVASGKFDWDSVFVSTIPRILSAKTNSEVNRLLISVINKAGQIQQTKKSKIPDSLFTLNKVGIGWITKSKLFENEVKDKLQFIYANKNQSGNKYIKMSNNIADFSGEKQYNSIVFPNLNYRLLFLSRFWNIINYFAPYKYLATDWDNVLTTFIPKVIHATDTLSYYKTLLELCKSLNDGHAQLWLPEQKSVTDLIYGHYTMPFYCEIINNYVVIRKVPNDSIAKALNVRQGDIVVTIDGKSLNEVIKFRRKYISASNETDEKHLLSWFILDGETSTAQLEIHRGNETLKTTVKRVPTANRNWGMLINYTGNEVGYKKLGDSVLLIYAMQIWDGNIDTIKQMVRQSKAVIFDVRNHPVNDAFFYIADPFLAEPKLINYTTIAQPDFPSFFKWEPAPKIGQFNDNPYKGKVVILADERTQSQGEYSCMVLQTIPNAVTIGSQTAGADGLVTHVPIGGGINLSYSGYGIYYPDKRQTQRVGIKIDIPVRKTIESITTNRDEILEKALEFIRVNKFERLLQNKATPNSALPK